MQKTKTYIWNQFEFGDKIRFSVISSQSLVVGLCFFFLFVYPPMFTWGQRVIGGAVVEDNMLTHCRLSSTLTTAEANYECSQEKKRHYHYYDDELDPMVAFLVHNWAEHWRVFKAQEVLAPCLTCICIRTSSLLGISMGWIRILHLKT